MLKFTSALLCTVLLCSVNSVYAEKANVLKAQADGLGMTRSLQQEGQAAVQRGMDWMVSKQQKDGHWSNATFPALTGLALWSLTNGNCSDKAAISKAVEFILSSRHEDGSFWFDPGDGRKGGGLPNYNTAICMVALHSTGRADLVKPVQKAREYMAKNQHLTGGDIYYGGFGYDPSNKRPYTDLSNSYLAYEAMRLTESVEDQRKEEKRVDLDWEAAQKFLERVQNDSDINTNSTWAADEAPEKGGFAYHPEQTRAGSTTNSTGAVKFRSMPGMTYAGMLSYIYADVDRADPRVKAAHHWIAENWNLNVGTRDPKKVAENRAGEGLFYMYNVMSKGLSAYGNDVIVPPEGQPFSWRIALSERLIGLQKIDTTGKGYWINPVSRYWEGDPILVTAYSLIALENALAAESID